VKPLVLALGRASDESLPHARKFLYIYQEAFRCFHWMGARYARDTSDVRRKDRVMRLAGRFDALDSSID
jgi:hypothetical protein